MIDIENELIKICDVEFMEIFNRELARELMREKDPLITDERVDYVWSKCKGNPWDASILDFLLKESAKMYPIVVDLKL